MKFSSRPTFKTINQSLLHVKNIHHETKKPMHEMGSYKNNAFATLVSDIFVLISPHLSEMISNIKKGNVHGVPTLKTIHYSLLQLMKCIM